MARANHPEQGEGPFVSLRTMLRIGFLAEFTLSIVEGLEVIVLLVSAQAPFNQKSVGISSLKVRFNKNGITDILCNPLKSLVGGTGLEPVTSGL